MAPNALSASETMDAWYLGDNIRSFSTCVVCVRPSHPKDGHVDSIWFFLYDAIFGCDLQTIKFWGTCFANKKVLSQHLFPAVVGHFRVEIVVVNMLSLSKWFPGCLNPGFSKHLEPRNWKWMERDKLQRLDDGTIYRRQPYLMVKYMVSCTISQDPTHWQKPLLFGLDFETRPLSGTIYLSWPS